MRKILFILSIFFFTQIGFAQAPPQGINYQAVVYSDNGNNQPGLNVPGQLLLNTSIRVRFSIIQNSANGTEVYKESHTTTTDAFGMFSLVIGQGTPQGTNTFPSINWGAGKHFLKVEIDKTGGTNYVVMSNQQLWSVPYALFSDQSNSANTADYANNAAHADSSDYSDLAGNGITGVSDNGNGTLTFTYLDGSSYTTGVLSGLTGPQGPQGVQGLAGQNGQSAYDLWIAQGNVGTETDFLNSLQGATGSQGPAGPTGATGPQGTPGSQNAWSLTGNAGTTPTTNFIGTTDAQDWVVKTNNTERMRVTSTGNVGIGTQSPQNKLEINNGNVLVKGSTPIITIEGSGVSFTHGAFLLKANSLSIPNIRGLGTFLLDTLGNNEWFVGRPYGDGLLGGSSDQFVVQRKVTNIHDFSTSGLRDGAGSLTGTQRFLTLTNNGFLGLGINIPTGKLHVNNDVTGADSSFVVTTDGKVGIGTSNPLFKFQILDNAGGIFFDASSGLSNRLKSTTSNPGVGRDILFNAGGNGGLSPDLYIKTTGIGASNQGLVGIGTDNPARTLHINAVMRLEPISTAPTSPAKGDMYFDSTINKLRVYDGTTWQSCW